MSCDSISRVTALNVACRVRTLSRHSMRGNNVLSFFDATKFTKFHQRNEQPRRIFLAAGFTRPEVFATYKKYVSRVFPKRVSLGAKF